MFLFLFGGIKAINTYLHSLYTPYVCGQNSICFNLKDLIDFYNHNTALCSKRNMMSTSPQE